MKRIAWTVGVVVALGATWSGGAAAQNGTAPPASTDGGTYQVRLRDLQERIDELKEQVRRMEQRTKLLADTVPSAVFGTVEADVDVRDVTTSAYLLTSVHVWLDDQLVYARTDEGGALGDLRAVTAFHGSIIPGEHSVRVDVRLSGNGAMLPYMRAYHFEMRDERRFVATEGRPAHVTIRAYERGGVTTPFEQRPAIAWEVVR
jgi:hypothetical protein